MIQKYKTYFRKVIIFQWNGEIYNSKENDLFTEEKN